MSRRVVLQNVSFEHVLGEARASATADESKSECETVKTHRYKRAASICSQPVCEIDPYAQQLPHRAIRFGRVADLQVKALRCSRVKALVLGRGIVNVEPAAGVFTRAQATLGEFHALQCN